MTMTEQFFDNKNDKSFEGKYYYATFKTEDLRLHSRNVREYEPTDAMIEMMREYGFVNEKPIIIVYENDIPSIVNGNQRKKTAEIVGIKEVPCMVFYDIDEAVKFATIDNTQRKWTPYQKYKNAIDYYKSLLRKNYSTLKAFNKTIKDLGITKYILSDYIYISKLPDLVKALIKKSENRDKNEQAIINKIDIHNKLKGKTNKLKPELAGCMGKYLIGLGINDADMCNIGIEIISENLKDAKIIIKAIARNYPDINPSETIRFYKTGSPHKQIQFIKNYTPEQYQKIVKRFVSLNMNANLYISTLIEEDLKSISKQNSNKENYIIKIVGHIRTGFSFNEVKEKAWNNTKLSQSIKNFLNEIILTDNGIYFKYDKHEIGIFKF